MRKVFGVTLCVLGFPAVFPFIVCCLCAGGGPQSKGDNLVLAALLPFALLGFPFVPVFVAGMKLLEEVNPKSQ